MNIDEETKEKLDLRIQHKKKIRELVSEVGKSSRDIKIVPREHDIQQSQTTMAKLQWMIKSMERTAALRTTMTTCFLGKEKGLTPEQVIKLVQMAATKEFPPSDFEAYNGLAVSVRSFRRCVKIVRFTSRSVRQLSKCRALSLIASLFP
jgi:hypothetical protein